MDDIIKIGAKVSGEIARIAALPFGRYEKIIGISESESFQNGLVVILVMYRMDVLAQPKETVEKKFSRVRKFLDAETEIQTAEQEQAEAIMLLATPGGDRQYLEGLLSAARMYSIAAQIKSAKYMKPLRGRHSKSAARNFVRDMRKLYQAETGKKPGSGDTGRFARFLAAVHDDFRQISREVDAELKQSVAPMLSVNIVALAKKGKN